MRLPEAFNGHPAYLAVWIAAFWLCIVPEIVLSAVLRSEPVTFSILFAVWNEFSRSLQAISKT
jgi:hypothetical protein